MPVVFFPIRCRKSEPRAPVIGIIRCFPLLPERMVIRRFSKSTFRTSRAASSARKIPVLRLSVIYRQWNFWCLWFLLLINSSSAAYLPTNCRSHPEPGVTLSFRAVALEISQGLLHTISDDGTYRNLLLDTSPPEEVASLQVDFSGSSIEV